MKERIKVTLDVFDRLEKEERLQEALKDTIALYNPRKKVQTRKKSIKWIDKKSIKLIDEEDNELIRRYINWNDYRALYQLIDYYTPLIKSMVWSPFMGVKGRGEIRLYPLQVEIMNHKMDRIIGYKYISSWAEDIISEAVSVFCQLVKAYNPNEGSFSGFIKNYLPYKMEPIYRQILNNLNCLYIDAVEDEKFIFENLSCYIPEEVEVGENGESDLDLREYHLTDKQREIVLLYLEGYNDTQVATILSITRQGVIKHKKAIRKKMSAFFDKAC